MDDGYGLMAADAAGVRPSLVTAVYARLLAARQEPDGHWETTDERPPESYSPFTATAVSLAAIQTHSHANWRADTAGAGRTSASLASFAYAAHHRRARLSNLRSVRGRPRTRPLWTSWPRN